MYFADRIKRSLFPGTLFFVMLLAHACSSPKTQEDKTGDQKDSTQQTQSRGDADCKGLYAEALKMDSILQQQTEIDTVAASKAIRAFTNFAYYCHFDTLVPIYLIKTAQVARAIGNIPQAKLALDQCIENYQSFRDRPAALFLLAQLYDEATYLNNENEARKLYQKIIDDYPKSPWVNSAKGAMSFLGQSDEEILRELKKKKK
jgi:outer membrane protein assembly factor BamD (BamD/ComL family)